MRHLIVAAALTAAAGCGGGSPTAAPPAPPLPGPAAKALPTQPPPVGKVKME